MVALLVPLQTLHAQRQGQWNITPRLGLVFWDKASGFQDPVLSGGDCDYPQFNHTCGSFTNNLMAGLSALYWFADAFAVGLAFDVARPVSNGAYFKAASMESRGIQELTLVSQRVTTLQYQVEAEWTPSTGRLSPFLTGGVGGYTIYLDPPKADQASSTGFESFSDLMFSVGIGIDWGLGSAGGLRLALVDMIYTGWEREKLNPVLPAYQTNLFPDLMPPPPDEKSTLHNFNLQLAFTFVAGGR
jgi:hypothetical protein